MIKSIDNVKQNSNSQILINHNKKQQPTFKGGAGIKFLDSFVKSQENLSVTRFVQDTTTNWFPKAALSRSKADFWEFSFLEFLESGLFYFAAPLLGEHLYRNKLFKKIQPKNLKQDISNNLPKSLEEIKKSKFCSKKEASSALEDIVSKAKFDYILLSYNDEGIISLEEIKNIFSKYGEYSCYEKKHRRFKADSKRNYTKDYTIEYIHCLKKHN